MCLWFAVLVVIAALSGSLVYHERVSGWPWSGPQWGHLCGRDYEKVGTPTTLQQLAHGVGHPVHLYPAYRASFLGPEVYADTAPGKRTHPPGEPCSGALYTKAGAGYQVFTLSGGV